jgi:D-3-phosphoglycerate dehydrogenase
VLAEALGMHVVFFDVVTKLPLGNARQVAQLKDLLAPARRLELNRCSPTWSACTCLKPRPTQWMMGAAEIAASSPAAC